MELEIGSKFVDRYVVEQALGGGGFGRVYRASDTLMGDCVAIKLLRQNRWGSAWDRWRESAMLRRLDVKGVARLRDEGSVRKATYLVTEFVDGDPFPSRLNPISWEQLKPLAVDLLDTLSCVHAEGVVHADLKPGNVLVTDEGVRLVDFGIAHRAVEGEGIHEIAGSPVHMSLDLFAGRPPSPRSDLYAVGVMLFEALTGTAMFESRAIVEWFGRLRELGPPAIGSRVEGLPAEAQELVDGLLGGESRIESATQALAVIDPRFAAEDWRDRVRRGHAMFDTPERLEALFHGPEIGWRLRSRAAEQLYQRTGADPDAVVRELESWIERRMAHFEHGHFRVGLRALSWLEQGGCAGPAVDATQLELGEEELGVLAFVAHTQPIEREILVQTLGAAPAETLEELGPDYRVEVDGSYRLTIDLEAHVPETFQKDARAFLESDAEPSRLRLDLAVVCEDAERVQAEAIDLAWSLDRQGRSEDGLSVLKRANRVLLEYEAQSQRRRVLEVWAKLALMTSNHEHVEEVLFAHHGLRTNYLKLLECTRQISRGHRLEHYQALSAMLPMADPEFEVLRHVQRSWAARFQGTDVQAAAVDDAREFLEARPQPRFEGIVHVLEGFLALERFEFARASRLMEEAAEQSSRPTARLSRMMNAGMYASYALDLERAFEWMRRAHDLALSLGASEYCVKTARFLRDFEYRLGDRVEPDPELLDAVRMLGDRWFLASTCLMHAASAWRCGLLDLAREAIEEATVSFGAVGFGAGHVLSSAFSLFLAPIAPCEERVERLHRRCAEVTAPRLRAQALGLLSLCVPEPRRTDWRREALSLVAESEQSERLEIIALDEIEHLEPAFEA